MLLQKYTAIKILIPLIIGVIGGYFIANQTFIILVSAIILSSVILIFKFKKQNHFSLIWIPIGLMLSLRINPINLLSESSDFSTKCIMQGEVIKRSYSDSANDRFVVEGNIYLDNLKKEYFGNAVLILKKNSKNINPGNKIILSGKAELIKNYSLPTEKVSVFSALSENISMVVYCDTNRIKISESNLNYNYYLDNLKEIIKNNLREYTPPEILDYAYSVVTGDLSQIPKEEKKLFSLTGTIHVLNVSGLHIGLFAFLLFELLKGFKNKKFKFVLFSVLLVIFITLTGLQPPGVRAGLVALFYYLVYLKGRMINMLNIILFSAIFFVLISPNIIFSVSFQLSFAASLSIVIFYPIIFNKLNFGEKWLENYGILRVLLTSFLVSFTSGIFLNPLVAFYFGMFSTVSYISNLIIIPLYNLFIIFTFLGLIFSFASGVVASWFAYSSMLSLKIVKFLIIEFSNFNYSYLFSENLFFIELIISIGIIYFIVSKSRRHLFFRMSTILVIYSIFFGFIYSESDYNIYYRKDYSITKFKTQNNTELLFINDKSSFLYTKGDKKALEFLKDFADTDSLIICWNGNNGMIIRDELKKKFKVNDIYLEKNETQLFTKLLKN